MVVVVVVVVVGAVLYFRVPRRPEHVNGFSVRKSLIYYKMIYYKMLE